MCPEYNGKMMKKKLLKRRGGRPGAASCCQSAVNASLPSRLPTSPSAISDGLLFKRENHPFRAEKADAEKQLALQRREAEHTEAIHKESEKENRNLRRENAYLRQMMEKEPADDVSLPGLCRFVPQ